jgi:putative FmdB family regulatory protein
MTYLYSCSRCGEVEVEQSIKDDVLTKCPTCNKSGVVRLITGGTFILKGDGWAKDLYEKKP